MCHLDRRLLPCGGSATTDEATTSIAKPPSVTAAITATTPRPVVGSTAHHGSGRCPTFQDPSEATCCRSVVITGASQGIGGASEIGEESLLADPDSCPADGDHFSPSYGQNVELKLRSLKLRLSIYFVGISVRDRAEAVDRYWLAHYWHKGGES